MNVYGGFWGVKGAEGGGSATSLGSSNAVVLRRAKKAEHDAEHSEKKYGSRERDGLRTVAEGLVGRTDMNHHPGGL